MSGSVVDHFVAHQLRCSFVVKPVSRIVLLTKKTRHESYGPLPGNSPKLVQRLAQRNLGGSRRAGVVWLAQIESFR
jgi:hypothetical protein